MLAPADRWRPKSPEKRSRVLAELRAWTRAREYRDRASKYLELARGASDPDVQRRFVAIASITTRWRRPRNYTANAKAMSGIRKIAGYFEEGASR